MTTGSQYFQSYENYFWIWEKDDDDSYVVAIPHSDTIAYKKFADDVIERLALQGLPPFGSLLLTIIATNPNGRGALDIISAILSSSLKTTDNVTLSKAIEFLKLISEIPDQYKQGNLRIMLMQTLFDRCHNILSLKDSNAIHQEYLKSGGADIATTKPSKFDAHIFEEEFRTVALLGSKFLSTEDIISKIAGVPDLSQYKIEFENSRPTDEPAAVDFIDELIDNNKTFHVGSLIRRLWGGLNIPVHNALPSQQPFGGISDLTNKGNFDKLLASEFANEDVVLLSRLANNEALYIHREVPPSSDRLQRVILIDASLKAWGTPKAIAFALMLAIVKHPKTDIECSVFVLGAEHYYPISTTSIHDIIEALQIVEGSLHAAKSIGKFIKEHGSDKNQEVLLITESSTLKYPSFVKAINEHPQGIRYMFLTDSEGNIDIIKRQHKNTRLIQHLKLDLEELWKKQHGATKTRGELKTTGEKSEVDYPILVDDASSGRKMILIAPTKEVLKITSEKTVLRSVTQPGVQKKGWDILYRNLPFNADMSEIGVNELGELILLLFSGSTRELALINLKTSQKIQFVFNQWKSFHRPSFFFEDGVFFHGSQNGGWSIHTNGTLVKVDFCPVAKYPDRKKEMDEVSARLPVQRESILKNIKNVSITKDNHLALNKHALMMRGSADHPYLQFSTAASQTLVEAKLTGKEAFEFPDGSTVILDRAGLIILRAANPSTPTIYIPTRMGGYLGVATDEEFAGNTFYQKEIHDQKNRPSQKIVNILPFYNNHINRFITNIVASVHKD